MMERLMTLEEFRKFAADKHAERGYTYDGKPYLVHLEMVAANVRKYSHLLTLLPFKVDPVIVEMAAYGHDLIEDCGVTFSDIKKIAGRKVAELILTVSNVPGEDRIERFLLTSPKIRKNIVAIFLKICDTMANMGSGKMTGNSMFEKYKKEHVIFRYVYYDKSKIFQEMWDEMEVIANH